MNKIKGHISKYMLKWIVIAVMMGVGGGSAAVALNKSIKLVSELGNKFPYFLAPVIGGILVAIILKLDADVLGSGSDKYIHSVNCNGGRIKNGRFSQNLLLLQVP